MFKLNDKLMVKCEIGYLYDEVMLVNWCDLVILYEYMIINVGDCDIIMELK